VQTAVAALTYTHVGSEVVILLLAVDPVFQKAGFGTHLLMLLGKCLLHRDRKTFKFFVLANERHNKQAWSFYTARGLKPSRNELPVKLQEYFQQQLATELGRPALENGLKWLSFTSFTEEFNIGPRTRQHVSPLFVLNPCQSTSPKSGLVEDEMVYAQFPGKLSLAESNWCGHELALIKHPKLFETATVEQLQAVTVGIFDGFPKQEMVVSWRSRADITPGVTMLNPAITLLIAWLQRDPSAPIWSKQVTLVPQCVMTPLWTMHFYM
jgi:hypothetical protein